jgi:hypothetical protein
VENPEEIVAIKIIFRAGEFKPRDLFDLAVIYNQRKRDILKVAPLLAPINDVLEKRMDLLESSGQFEVQIGELSILDGGLKIRCQELDLCRQCLRDISLRQDKPLETGLSRWQ